MKTTIIDKNEKYTLRLIEFIAPAGWTITSFYQLIKAPSICLACTNSYDEALFFLKNSQFFEEDSIEKSREFFLGEKVLISADELAAGILNK